MPTLASENFMPIALGIGTQLPTMGLGWEWVTADELRSEIDRT